jgi:hypothetical protein
LSLIFRVAVRAPVAADVKVTVIVHVPPAAATVVPHVLVWLKSPAFAPLIEIPEIASAALPALVRVIVCEAVAFPGPPKLIC